MSADFETGLDGASSESSSSEPWLEPDSGLATAFAEEVLVVETFEGTCLLAAFFAVAFAAMGLEGTSSSSEDSSLDSPLELDSGLATAFAGDVLVAADFTGEDAFAEAFAVTGLVGPCSEAEDSSSEDSSLDSSLELDVAAPVLFVGVAFTAGAFVGTGLACVGLVATAPLVAALGGGPFAFDAGFEGSWSEPSLSLSLTGFAEAFGIALVGFGDTSGSLSLESEAESLSLDSEELALGGALDYIGK